MMQLENAIRRCNRENVLTVFTVSAVIIVDLKKVSLSLNSGKHVPTDSGKIFTNRAFWHFLLEK